MTDQKIATQSGLTYAQAGVDIDAGNLMVEKIKPLVRTTMRPGFSSDIGGFGGLFDLRAAGFRDPVLVAANDGVGTKLKIAIASNMHQTIGIDLVAMCVNDLIVQGAEPLFFLDYFACSKLDPTQGAQIVAGIAAGCREAGCALIGGETAEMPGLYQDQDYDLAGFAVGAAERSALLPKDNMASGDVILGLRSSGLHSNGFSLVRRIIEQAGLEWLAPCPWSADETVAAALLTPTRLYVRPIMSALKAHMPIKALAHITGGGLDENIPRVLPKNLNAQIDLNQITPHAVFSWLAKQGNVAPQECLRVFNCGVGMVVITDRANAQIVTHFLEQAGQEVVPIGHLVFSTNEKSQVLYQGQLRL